MEFTVVLDTATWVSLYLAATYFGGAMLVRWGTPDPKNPGDRPQATGEDVAFSVLVFLLSPIVMPLLVIGYLIGVLGKLLFRLLTLGQGVEIVKTPDTGIS